MNEQGWIFHFNDLKMISEAMSFPIHWFYRICCNAVYLVAYSICRSGLFIYLFIPTREIKKHRSKVF